MNPTKARLLIVDDHQQTRLLLTNLMRQLGISKLDQAADGGAALEQIERNHYDLVLADWNMQILSGIALVRIIREMPEAKRPPVVLISCDVSPKRGREALEAGVSGLVEKPFVNEVLSKKVLRIIASRSPISEFIYGQRPEANR